MQVDLYFKAEDEQRFKQAYAVQFLASFVAKNYTEACMMGQHERLRKPPVEDAHHLAEEAWNHWVEIIGLNPSC